MSEPVGWVGDSFLRLVLFRGIRNLLYRFIGLWRPSWRRALPYLKALDAYSDSGTMHMRVYADPRFETNIRVLEEELRRVRGGGDRRDLQLPHDFPVGARDAIGAMLAVSRG